jgi:hypothetical protein
MRLQLAEALAEALAADPAGWQTHSPRHSTPSAPHSQQSERAVTLTMEAGLLMSLSERGENEVVRLHMQLSDAAAEVQQLRAEVAQLRGGAAASTSGRGDVHAGKSGQEHLEASPRPSQLMLVSSLSSLQPNGPLSRLLFWGISQDLMGAICLTQADEAQLLATTGRTLVHRIPPWMPQQHAAALKATTVERMERYCEAHSIPVRPAASCVPGCRRRCRQQRPTQHSPA